MNQKVLSVISVSLAVIMAAIAAITVSVKRADIARANAEVAASEEARAEAEKRTAIKNAEIQAGKQREAEALKAAAALKNKTSVEERQSREEESRRQALEEKARTAAAKEAAHNAEKAKADADQAQAKQKEAEALAARARAEADAKLAIAQVEADRLAVEKLKADKILAEAKLLELRKVDFETLQHNLLEWKQDLEERERALIPEKTIADLQWAGGMEDSTVDEKGNVVKLVKPVYNPETDRNLPAESRRLAKEDRELRERAAARKESAQNAAIDTLVRLYDRALAEDRTVDAQFYLRSIRSIRPDWNHAK